MKSVALALCVALVGASAVAQAPNALTPAEKAAGWKLLFDGQTTDGWRGFKTPDPDAGWTAKGELSPDPKTSADIMTKDSFGNFELSFEWKVGPKGNSGLMFHVVEGLDETYHSGPEFQLVDNARGERPAERAGALYALYAPENAQPKPVGEFNQSRLLVDHGKVEHWLNGVKVAAYDMSSADFKARVAASKFARWPTFAASPTGHIALQNHGDPVAFRNLKIRPLP